MRIFVTGATGFVGAAVVPDLIAAGHEVIALARSEGGANALAAAGATAVAGDLRDPDGLARHARDVDAVIHAAFDHDFSRLAEICELDRRAIAAIGGAMAGSGKLMIVTAGLPITPGKVAEEDDVPLPGAHGIPRLSEQTAMALLDRGVRPIVIRMPQVHDRARQGFASYLAAHARETGVSAYSGEGSNRWPAVHRLDAARLYRLALERGEAGRRYHAVAETGVPVRAVAEAIGERLGVPVASLTPEASADHFGWLDRVAKMDVPASGEITRRLLAWKPTEAADLLADIACADQTPATA